MFGTMKRKALNWCVIFSSVFVFASCNSSSTPEERPRVSIKGETQGTTYEIIVCDPEVRVTKAEIDSVLKAFDLSLSTYHPTSVISRLNEMSSEMTIEDKTGFFKKCYEESQKVYTLTDGAFDPSVYPLVKGWGFMDNIQDPLSQSEVDSLLQFVGFDTLHTIAFTGNSIALKKDTPGYKLDFNAIAQGYSVDVLDQFLKKRGQKNYYIEIGGELILRGTNAESEKWVIGIDVPEDNSTTHSVENCVRLSNEAIATSGNYRKFYEKDGKKYAHCLDPKTGFPAQHSLLSVSVIAPTCAEADAYATAFMVFGTSKTLQFVKDHPELKLKVYLLESKKDGSIKRLMSDNFKSYLDEA